MNPTNLQKQILLHMPGTDKGVNAQYMHYRIYGRKASPGSLLSDRITRGLMTLAQEGLVTRPQAQRMFFHRFTNPGYRLTEHGAAWVKAERERIEHASAEEGSEVEEWVGAV